GRERAGRVFSATGLGRSPDRYDRGELLSPQVAGWTVGSPGCPPLRQRSHHGNKSQGLSLCVPRFRVVCPFEDERRCDPGETRKLAPEAVTETGSVVCC